MSGLTVSADGGKPFVLSELELARGRRDLKRQLAEIRAACPAMRIVEDFAPAPMVTVGWWHEGAPVEVRVDPLNLVQRALEVKQ
jgi:hypothetical protein